MVLCTFIDFGQHCTIHVVLFCDCASISSKLSNVSMITIFDEILGTKWLGLFV